MFVYELGGCGFKSSCSQLTSDFASVLSKDFLNIQATIECGFTQKCVHVMIRTYNQNICLWHNFALWHCKKLAKWIKAKFKQYATGKKSSSFSLTFLLLSFFDLILNNREWGRINCPTFSFWKEKCYCLEIWHMYKVTWKLSKS